MAYLTGIAVDCPHPSCNGHGLCVNGTCMCKKGWRGVDCASTDKEALQCLPGKLFCIVRVTEKYAKFKKICQARSSTLVFVKNG